MCPQITLFMCNGAGSFVPHALLSELEIPYEAVILTFDNGVMEAADGSFTHEEYKKIHPSGYVPALKADGQIITELPAIVGYIAELKPERQLLGSTPLERAKITEMMVWLSGTLHAQGYGALWRSKRFSDSDADIVHESIRDKGRKTIMTGYDHIEQRLEGPYAVGGRFTAVDITLYTMWRWGALRIGVEQNDFAERYPKYTELARGVEKMESVRKTLSEESSPLAFMESRI